MDAGYAVLIEEYTRAGIPLLEAIEQTSHMRAGGDSVERTESGVPVPTEEQLAKQNEASLRELQNAMRNL